jgi:hypothetical protein
MPAYHTIKRGTDADIVTAQPGGQYFVKWKRGSGGIDGPFKTQIDAEEHVALSGKELKRMGYQSDYKDTYDGVKYEVFHDPVKDLYKLEADLKQGKTIVFKDKPPMGALGIKLTVMDALDAQIKKGQKKLAGYQDKDMSEGQSIYNEKVNGHYIQVFVSKGVYSSAVDTERMPISKTKSEAIEKARKYAKEWNDKDMSAGEDVGYDPHQVDPQRLSTREPEKASEEIERRMKLINK